jgi:hypothetical protein
MHDQALAWFVKHNRVKPDQGFMEKTTAQFEDRFRRRAGFIYELGPALLDSRRPTIVLVRCGAVHVFELTNLQARNWRHDIGGVSSSDFSDRDEFDPAPVIELSDPQFDNPLQIDANQPVTGTVKVRCLAAVKGPLMLRFAAPAGGSMYKDYFQLPEGLPVGRSSCSFGFGRLRTRENKPWPAGPYVLSLEVCSNREDPESQIKTVLSNSVAAVVNVSPAPK